MANTEYAPNQGHQQCSWCTKMTAGAAAGEVIGEKLGHVGTNAPGEEPGRLYTQREARERNLPQDFSHGLCMDCYNDQMEKYRTMTQRRLVEQEKERLRQAKREVPDEPTG